MPRLIFRNEESDTRQVLPAMLLAATLPAALANAQRQDPFPSATVAYESSSEVYACQRLANGNTVMCNWLGHGQFGKAPHLIEVTPDKKVVWTSADHHAMRAVANVQVLDVPGDGTDGPILH